MSKDTDKSLFIFPSMPRLYQHLLAGYASYEALGSRIIQQIKAAHAFRQVEQVRELAGILINIPIKEYQLIAQYYLVWCKCRDYEYPTETLERIVEQTKTYKTKALFSRGAVEWYKGENEAAIYFYTEALKTSPTISEYVDLSRTIAVLKATEGFHKSALMDLENLVPLIRHAEPRLYYDFLNSYAVELGEAGRKDEARNIVRHVLASPFIHAYPEWRETAIDLKQSSRSFVTVPLIQREHVEIEVAQTEHASKPEQESDTQPASVLSFPKLREAPQPEKPDKLSPQEYAELTTGDKRKLILAAVKSGAISEDDYYKMMAMLGLLTIGPADKILDLEDAEVLDNIAVIWSAQIGAEELAGFLSALRDCEDRIRQREIIDRMIRIAFQETQLYGITEEQWRSDV